jgi:hypothetical protein
MPIDSNKLHHHPDDQTPDVAHIRNEHVTHEYSDVNIRAIVKFAISLAVGCVLVGLIVYGTFKLLYQRELRAEIRLTPIERTTADKLPPEPRLQLAPGHGEHPLSEMKDFRAAQNDELNGYGWTQKASGTVHIPIDSAKAMLLHQNISTRTVDSLTLKNEQGVLIPSATSGGRTLEWRDH